MLSHACERQTVSQGNGKILRVIPGLWALQRVNVLKSLYPALSSEGPRQIAILRGSNGNTSVSYEAKSFY